MNIPVLFQSLPNQQERDAAYGLLEDFYKKSLAEISLPIDVDAIVESLGYALEYGSLADRGHPGALGLIHFDKKQIWIDATLSDDLNSSGRYHFTVAHEVGHHMLHKPQLDAQRAQMSLFARSDNQILCRIKDQEERHEKQADRFAARLLMPSVLVRKEYEALKQECRYAYQSWQFKEWIVRILKDRFEVSQQAMMIRLHRMRILLEADDRQLELLRA